MKIKSGDKVQIISGKYRGKTGKVTRVYKKRGKIVVEKINMVVKHIKKTPQRKGERITFEAPVYACKAMVVCPQCDKTTRVAYTIISKDGKGKKQRICKKCHQSIDQITSVKTSKKK